MMENIEKLTELNNQFYSGLILSFAMARQRGNPASGSRMW